MGTGKCGGKFGHLFFGVEQLLPELMKGFPCCLNKNMHVLPFKFNELSELPFKLDSSEEGTRRSVYRSNHFLTESAISPKECIAIPFIFSQFLPHGFDGLTKFSNFCLSLLLFLKQLISFGSQLIEILLFETNLLWGGIVVIKNESVEI